MEINASALSRITQEQAWHYRVLPKSIDDREMVMYCDDTELLHGLSDELEILLGRRIALDPQPPATISQLLHQHYPKESGQHQFQKMTLATAAQEVL